MKNEFLRSYFKKIRRPENISLIAGSALATAGNGIASNWDITKESGAFINFLDIAKFYSQATTNLAFEEIKDITTGHLILSTGFDNVNNQFVTHFSPQQFLSAGMALGAILTVATTHSILLAIRMNKKVLEDHKNEEILKTISFLD